ncbi:MAG: hypothetical protein J5972_01065 [Eubacterium sp.]|nr:hypothetical protein [Eubacterium sp.]
MVYYGEREWKYPLRLHEMIQFPDGMEDAIKPYVADYLACKKDKEKWEDFLKRSQEIVHVEELLDVIAEISGDEHYLVLREKIREENLGKEKWNMCEIAVELERIGMEKGLAKGREEGRSEGVFALIQDNLEMGIEKDKILEKVVRLFSVTWENAVNYYSQVVME